MPTRRAAALVTAITLSLVAAKADAADPDPISATDTASGYAYTFTDDPLQAIDRDPPAPRIFVARHVLRTQLMRPRTAFVIEMLKSVQAL
jgi:hypothetical protein